MIMLPYSLLCDLKVHFNVYIYVNVRICTYVSTSSEAKQRNRFFVSYFPDQRQKDCSGRTQTCKHTVYQEDPLLTEPLLTVG